MEVRGIFRIIKSKIENLVLGDDAPTVEGELGWNSVTKNLRYFNGTSVVEVNPSGGGGSVDTSILDEDGNSENLITFDSPKIYKNASGTIKFSMSGAVNSNITQLIEHKSANDLIIEPSDDIEVRYFDNFRYNNDNTTVNLILISYNGNFTSIGSKRVVYVSIIELDADIDSVSVSLSAPAVGTPLVGSYTSPSNEANSLFYFRKADNAGMTTNVEYWNGSAWQATKVGILTNSYTPVVGDLDKYIDLELRVGVLQDNYVKYSNETVTSAPVQVGGALSTVTLEMEDIFTNPAPTNVNILGTVTVFAAGDASGGQGILLPDANNKALFTFTAENKVYNRLEMQVRIGDASNNLTYNGKYIIDINGTLVNFTLEGSPVPTDDFGGDSAYGLLVANNVDLELSNNMEISALAAWAFVDYLKLIG